MGFEKQLNCLVDYSCIILYNIECKLNICRNVGTGRQIELKIRREIQSIVRVQVPFPAPVRYDEVANASRAFETKIIPL